MGSAQQTRKILADFALGQKDYRLGFHPVWEVFRSLYQMTRRPYVVGGAALFTGYFYALLHRSQRSVSRDLLKFQQQDQLQRLRKFFDREKMRLFERIKQAFRLRPACRDGCRPRDALRFRD
jgi:hypothetical protein